MRCAVALSAIAARADEHLSLTPRTQKQPGIVHRSPRRRGLDDPTSPGNTGLGAVRQCGSVAQPRTLTAKSLRSEAASVSSPSPISLQPLNDVTLAHEATALCDQHHRFAGETTASQRRGRGAASEHVRPRRRIRLRRAVRRISALLRSHQQNGAGAGQVLRTVEPCRLGNRPFGRPRVLHLVAVGAVTGSDQGPLEQVLFFSFSRWNTTVIDRIVPQTDFLG